MATTSNSQTQPTFVSSSTPTKYDVFLSFRGIDTRLAFTSYLYDKLDSNGIRTFMDKTGLGGGEVISDALLDAIRNSKAYIVVFSENYATSPWCLNELVEILSCHKTAQRLIIPVFYKIDPCDVRYQTGSFKQAFKKHQARLLVLGETEKVDNWRFTLKQVADLSGHHLSDSDDRSEANFINEIVDGLLPKINPKTLYVTKYPVGLNSRVDDITARLSSGTEGVVKFGIFGMGGVGKTTLAKALFNQLLGGGSFRGSCFLANVRETSETAKGLVCLQQQLINDVLNSPTKVKVHNVEHGINLIRERIRSAKLLILIDDIYDIEQYESLAGPFASGSVVIVTTRDEEMLDKVGVEPKYRYMLKELDDAQSRKLFTKYAFQNAEPPDNLLAFYRDILGLAGGLPLALQVFGSYLSIKKEVGWKSYIETLQQYPNSTIEQKLSISLNALELDDRMLKNIFIDIACFFIGWNKVKAVEVLETYYSHADEKMNTLKKRCLLTMDKGKLEMHDLLRDMGRNIARNKALDEPGKYSRLWLLEDIEDVLKNYKGTEAIEGIIPQNFLTLYYNDALEEKSFTTETFKWMRKLRFLYIKEVNLTGSFEQMFEDLRVLCWASCPLKCLPSDFYPEKLVILELPRSNMKTLWDLNKVSHVFGKLKTLNMFWSKDLSTTPDFTKLPFLETLDLGCCITLEEIHMSIGSLARLVSFNLKGCKKLRSLPDTIRNLRALEVLDISDCDSLEALPDAIGSLTKLADLNLSNNKKLETLPDTICNIESLRKLNADGLTVSKLPDSIGHLTKLVELKLGNNKVLESLPDTICNLISLEILNINSCSSLEALPTSIGNIESLTEINVTELITVSKLPDSIGRLSKIVELDLRNNKKLETLPDTICNLSSLEILRITRCEKLETLPDELWKITRLRKLIARETTMLKKLPDIESSQIALSLQELKLSSSGITALPSGFSQLSNLQSLDISNCDFLLSIPKLPPNLKWIYANWCKSLERLPNLSNLKHLEELELTNSGGLTYIQGLEDLISIRKLHLGDCGGLPNQHLTKPLFKVYCELGREISVGVSLNLISRPGWFDWIFELPYWTSGEYSESIAALYAHLLPNESHNFMGIILCFKEDFWKFGYSVRNTTSGFIWSSHNHHVPLFGSLMVIVPKSIFPVTDDDHRIELTVENVKIVGIHLLYKAKTKTIDDVVEKHVIDIDALKLIDPLLFEMFLDIACFFVGWEKKKVVQILETYYTNVHHNFDILKNRCLLATNSRDELHMNDLHQYQGRKIARNNSFEEPEKYSRLWLSTDMYDVFKNHKGTEVIEGIVPRKSYYDDTDDALTGESITLETFKKMRKLRFLYLRKVHLTGSYEQTFQELRWLYWDWCPLKCLPSEFYPPKLVILELRHSNIITMSEPNMVPHVFEKLKIMDMSGSKDLTTTPDFTKLPCLEILHLEGCKSLEEVHISIGSLVRLLSLYLHSCVKLRSLPDTICNLRSLEILDISGCEKLEILSDQLCTFTSLRELVAGGATLLKKIPQVEPRQMALSLQKLDFSRSGITTLPFSISKLSNLKDLNLEDCHCLMSIPELPCNLKKIMANGCMSMGKLQNLSNLKQLKYLNLEDCSGLAEIQGLKGLASIRRLHLEGCNSSLLAYIFTESFFQVFSQFGHPIEICSTEFPDWIRQSSEDKSTMSLNLPPNVSHNYLGMILCIRSLEQCTCYSVENTTSDFIWRGIFISSSNVKSLMVIVPRTTFSLEYGDDKIKSKATRYAKIYGIHLLHKNEED